MKILTLINRKKLHFSISTFNIVFFLMLLLFTIPNIQSIRGSILTLLVIVSLFLVMGKKDLIGQSGSLLDKQSLYHQNSELMNQVLNFKANEVNGLEREISLKDRLYKQLFDLAPDAFVIYNDEAIAYCNDAFVGLIGANDQADLLSQEVFQFIHPKSLAKAKKTYHDLLNKTIEASSHSMKILRLDNTIKEVNISSSIIFFKDTYYFFSCVHDLSDHKEQERINTELENNVATEKFKVEFFANISHDIKTPINVIYSAVQLQDMYIESNDYDKVLVYNTVITQNCLRLQKLLNDVLDITKIDANHFKPSLELCNIICSIEFITQSTRSYLQHKDIVVIFDTNVEDKLVMTDVCFIERIMLNLISNAIKYGKQDGHVWVTLHDTGNNLIISVKDDGIGIPKAHISNIFKRFHKINQGTTNESSSNGIGLSLVKSMVELLGGTIDCLSKEGAGSEFVIILPMVSLEGDENKYCEYATSLSLSNKLNIELSDI